MATTSNTIPDITDTTIYVVEGSSTSVNLLYNYVDAQGDLLSITLDSIAYGYPGQPLTTTGISSNPCSLTADGIFTYTALLDLDAGQQRIEAFTFTIFDGMAYDTVTIYVTETGTAPPVAAPDDYAITTEGQAVVVSVLSNDASVWHPERSSPVSIAFINGQALTSGNSVALFNSLTQTVIGQVSLSGTDSLVVAPQNGFVGQFSFDYQASYIVGIGDFYQETYIETVTVDVLPAIPAPPTVGPIATPDAYSRSDMQPLIVDASAGVLANDIANGNLIRAQLVSGPDNGTIDFNSDGSFSFTPSPASMALPLGSIATATFSYQVFSGTAASPPTTVTLSFVQTGVPPLAVNDALSLIEDGQKIITATDLFGTDGNGPLNDASAAALFSTIAIEALPQHGALYLSGQQVSAGTIVSVAQLAAGALEYRPAANYAGDDSFQYRVSDGTAYSNLATVSLTVEAVNDAPATTQLNFVIDEGDVIGALPNPFNLAPTVTDVDDSSFRFRLLDISHGPNDGGMPDAYSSNYFSLSADGFFSYDSRYLNLQPGQQQTESFHYLVTDGQATSEGFIHVTIVGTDFGGPVAAGPDDYVLTPEGQPVLLDITINDALTEPVTVSPQVVSISGLDPFEGTVTIASAPYVIGLTKPMLTFTPASGFTGLATFSYTVNYAYGLASEVDIPVNYTANVTVRVVPDTSIDAPDGVADTYLFPLLSEVRTGLFDNVLVNDVSPLGAALGAQLVSGPAQGTLDFNADGSFTYRPTAQMLASAPGTEMSVTFTYRVMNGSAQDSDATVVTLLLRQPFPAPTAVDDVISGADNQPLTITPDSLFGTDGAGPLNDTQPDGQAFTEIRLQSLPQFGTLLLDKQPVGADTVISVADLAAGKLVFMPSPGFTGNTSFDYSVRSGDRFSMPATVTLSIAAVADAPVMMSPQPQPLMFIEAPDASVQQLFGAILPLQFNDADSILMHAQVQMISPQMTGGGTIPAEVLDALANALLINEVLVPDGAGSVLTVSPTFANTPIDLDFLSAGQDLIVPYHIIALDDSGLQSAPYVVLVRIAGSNDAPRATDLHAQISVGGSVAAGAGLLSQVVDPDAGDTLRLASINGLPVGSGSLGVPTAVGSLIINPDGSFSFQPNPDGIAMTAAESILVNVGYQVADGSGAMVTSTLHLTVNGTNQAPMAFADQFGPVAAGQDTQFFAAALLANDIDPDNGESALLRLASVAFGSSVVSVPATGSTTLSGTWGILTIDASGNLSYQATTPAADGLARGAQASDVFMVTVADPYGETGTAALQIDVVGADHAPASTADAYQVAYGQALTVNASTGVLANDSDYDGDALSAVLATGPSHGSLSLASDGSFTYTASSGYVGADSFSYVATGGGASGAPTTVTLTVQAPPLALDKLLFINEIAVNAGAATVTINTNNGALPDKVTTGTGRIELFNFSSGSISAADLSKARVEVVGLNAKLSVIGLDHLTGLTESATGSALSGVALQANGSLVLYEPNGSGIGIWQTYSASGALLLSGTYQDNSWGLGASVSSAIAVNLVEAGLSIDYFAANGAPVSGLTDGASTQTALSGVGTLSGGAHAEGSLIPFALPDLSSPWFGNAQWSPSGVTIPADVLSLLNQNLQFNASLASSSDTVFARTYEHYLALSGGSDPAFVDYNDAGDWTYGSKGILTLGKENVVLSKSAVAFVANAQDATDDLNPLQGYQPVSDLIAGIANESGQTIAVYSGYGEGGRGHDFLYGVASDDILVGGAGNDYLYGSAGNDWLEGGSGADRLMGATGNDRLFGGTGRDWLNGGSGADVFVFRGLSESRTNAPDIIEDFVHGIDMIDLSAIDANTKRAGDQAFTFAGRATTVAYNSVSWFESGGNTVVQVDVDGNKSADLQLTLLGTNLALTASDFVL